MTTQHTRGVLANDREAVSTSVAGNKAGDIVVIAEVIRRWQCADEQLKGGVRKGASILSSCCAG